MKENKDWKAYKSWRLGYKAGKRGRPRTVCPYKLTPEITRLLLKRHRWEMGWEEATYSRHPHPRMKE